MVNDQYSIPQPTPKSSESAYFQLTPERETGPYWGIKEIESRINSYREAALATQRPPKKWLGGLVLMPSHQPTVASLVEKESEVGGSLFGPGHKFWLDVESTKGFAEGVSDWYHMQPNPNDPKNPIVLRFQTTANSIHKLYNGIEYAPTVQDLEIFVQAVEAYSRAILPLYPLDYAIEELSNEADPTV